MIDNMKLNIALPYWNGKRWIFKKSKPKKKTIRKTYIKKSKPLTIEQIGERDGKFLCSLWNSQPNPSKIYIYGNRLHHGLVGLGLGIYGILENDDYLRGLGKAIMKDDINDVPDWLNFKK